MKNQLCNGTTSSEPSLSDARNFFDVIEILKKSKKHRSIIRAYQKTGDYVALCQAIERLPEWNEIFPRIFRGTSQSQIAAMAKQVQENCRVIPYCDNYLFQTVMSHEDVLQPFLDMILGYHVTIEAINQEHVMQAAINVHGIRLDVSVRLADRSLVDIEMQVASQDFLLQRMAYYRANTTIDMLRKNGDTQVPYPFVRPTIIIFVCAFAPSFVGKQIVTVFEGVAQHNNSLKNPFMGKDIVFNLYGTEGGIDPSLFEFKDMLLSDGTKSFSEANDLSKRFVGYAEKIRQDKEWRLGRMTLDMFRAESFMAGKSEGIAEGEAKERLASIRNIMEGFNVSAQQAMQTLKIPSSEWEKYASQLQ